MMTIAEVFYNEVPLEERAEKEAIDTTEEIKGGVVYKTHTFVDRSKLTFGSNGYIGCEVPA